MALHTFENFVIEQIEPESLTHIEQFIRAQAVQDVNCKAWRHKFVPGLLPERDLAEILAPDNYGMVAGQIQKIARPTREAKYWLAYDPLGDQLEPNEDSLATGALRVETYKPRKPWKRSYPNVTDLEVADGSLRLGKYEKQAAALLFLALKDYDPETKVSAYIVAEDNDSSLWLAEAAGFMQTDRRPTGQVGETEVTYAQMLAPSVARVHSTLTRQYPFLAEAV